MKAVVFVNDQRMEIIIQRLRSAGIQVQEGRCEKTWNRSNGWQAEWI